ncbi:MAG: DEAD/DEAH box helicase [SAR324 cluster bacterium]|nr:DEAD/DEAH box helicase [SAR324 cluster bacterium]
MSDSIVFSDLSLPPSILKTLKNLGYEIPTPIQKESIPLLMNGRDLIGQAQTGTGKTAAFALPILSRLDVSQKSPQILVLTPTRELAIQVSEAFQAYARHLKGFHVLPVYGGQSYTIQLNGLKRGVHVVVGTPGRILDHLRRETLKIDELRTVVLDEADEMLNMGFIEDVEKIISGAPKTCQIAMFSATMPGPVRRIAKLYLKSPSEIKIESKTTTVESVEQRYLLLNNNQKLEALTRLLEVENYDGVLVFVRTKSATAEISEKLEARGFAAAALNGDMSQMLRERTVNHLKKRKLDIVVATDVAARGLDVDRLSLVINYDIPHDVEPYIHRIGRTGRAGREGKAILLVTPREKRLLRDIERATKQKIEPTQLPSSQEIGRKRAELFKERVLQTFANQPLHFFTEHLKELKKDLNMSLEELAPALLFLAQKDQSLQVEKSISELKYAQKEESQESREKLSGKAKSLRKRKLPGNVKFDCYRVEVGKRHKARVGDIVGAIANEADIESQFIGNIRLYDDYSTVELPEGMPKEIFHLLKKTHIRQRKLNLRLLAEA